MAHGRILETHVKPFHGHWGSRVHGKRKNWQRDETLGHKFRENFRSLLSFPLIRKKAV